MHDNQYSDKKIKKAIKCYYLSKAMSLARLFSNEEMVKKLIESYIDRCIIPETSPAIDFLCIILSDIDTEIYDLSYRCRKDRLVQLHKEHFVVDLDEHAHAKSVNGVATEDID